MHSSGMSPRLLFCYLWRPSANFEVVLKIEEGANGLSDTWRTFHAPCPINYGWAIDLQSWFDLESWLSHHAISKLNEQLRTIESSSKSALAFPWTIIPFIAKFPSCNICASPFLIQISVRLIFTYISLVWFQSLHPISSPAMLLLKFGKQSQQPQRL